MCLAISAAVWQGVASVEVREHRLLFATELLLGLLAYVLVHFRRSAPVPIALAIALAIAMMSAFSDIAAGRPPSPRCPWRPCGDRGRSS